jgi:BTB/POZ domain
MTSVCVPPACIWWYACNPTSLSSPGCCIVTKSPTSACQARSPVFKALLGGGMREGKEDQVEIQDVRAPVFRALLHFAYTDALPEVDRTAQCCACMLGHEHGSPARCSLVMEA